MHFRENIRISYDAHLRAGAAVCLWLLWSAVMVPGQETGSPLALEPIPEALPAPGAGLQGERALQTGNDEAGTPASRNSQAGDPQQSATPSTGDAVGTLLPGRKTEVTGGPPLSPAELEAIPQALPVTASTPFAPAPDQGGGPVVMGTDLQPNAAVTPLLPDNMTPEFLDEPLVLEEDPWVFGVEVSALYDDNIRLSSRDPQDDFLFVLGTSVAWQWGDTVKKRGSWARLYYQATGIFFLKENAENKVDHDLQAGGQKRWGRLAAAMEGRFQRLSGATPDLGDRVERNDSRVSARVTYDMGGRTFVEAESSWNAVRYEDDNLADYDEWAVEGFAGYELSGRTRVAAGGAVGQLDVAGAGTQDFQRALVKLNRASTGALGMTGKAGAEFRQTRHGSTTTPVFALAADWEPVEDGTQVTVEAFRESVSSGSLAGENYLRTGGALRLFQDLGPRFGAGLAAGYERLDYSQAGSGRASGREDDYYFVRPSLKYEFAARRRAEVFYSFREDDSSLEDFSFTANQWGLSFGLEF